MSVCNECINPFHFENAGEYVANNLKSFAQQSLEVAKDILTSNRDADAGRAQRSSSSFTWFQLGGNTTYVMGGDRRRSDDPSKDTRVAAVIIGAIVSGCALFFFGKALREKEENEELLNAAKMMNAASVKVNAEQPRALSAKVVDLAKKRQESALWSLATKGALIAAGVLALVGGFFASSVIIATGLILGLATMGVCIFRLSYSDAKLDDGIKKDARQINALAEKILSEKLNG